MRDIDKINFYDFYFNGHYLSEFGGIVASNDGGKIIYSLLPQREYVTNRTYGFDIEAVMDTRLSARPWEIPVYFENLEYSGIRRIANWLNVTEPKMFYFKGDSVYINAMIDSDSVNVNTYTGTEGLFVIKFIAHDPFYYDLYSNEKLI